MLRKSLYLLSFAAASHAGLASAYLSPEHKRIGDTAVKSAFAAPPVAFPWVGAGKRTLVDAKGRVLAAAGVYLSFGDMVALYGDFRQSVAQMRKTSASQLRELQKFASDGKAASHLVALAKEGPGGAAMFLLNRSHFSSSAVSAYRDHHRVALAAAADAGRTGNVARLHDALHHDALACHSLTDLFAPGHDLVDRTSFVKELLNGRDSIRAAGLKNPLKALEGLVQAGSALFAIPDAKRHHNQFNENGVELENLRGDRWLGYGDGKLAKQTAAASRISADAVALSLTSLFDAYRRGKAGAVDAELLVDPALFGAMRLIPVGFRNARSKSILGKAELTCGGTQYCDLLQRAVVHATLRIESKGTHTSPTLVELANPEAILRPGDVFLKRVAGSPSLLKRLIMAGQKAVKAVRGTSSGSVRAGSAMVVHAVLYLGNGQTADASQHGVTVRPLSEQEGEVFEVFRPKDRALAAAAVAAARAWSTGRLKYSASPMIFLRSSSFGPKAKKAALMYGKARATAGGPKGIKALFCSELVIAIYQAAAVGAQLAAKPKLAARDVKVPAALALHAHNTSPLVLHGSLTLAAERKEWRHVGFLMIEPKPELHGK